MNRHLTCDDVFDQLTRAPFPSGQVTDELVDQHLSVCHECRKMAEALRPATDLFQEVLSAEQRRTLPAYRGRLADLLEAPAMDERVATATIRDGDNPVSAGRRPWYYLPAVGVAILLLVAIAKGPGAPNLRQVVPGDTMGGAAADAQCLFASLTVPEGCLPSSAVGAVKRAGAEDKSSPAAAITPASPYADTLQRLNACSSCHETAPATTVSRLCCTGCHSARSDTKPPMTDFHRLTSSCSACHG